jgi:hypothetical protein
MRILTFVEKVAAVAEVEGKFQCLNGIHADSNKTIGMEVWDYAIL